jgi:tripartite-type tricarboxylate transporter receptor subunit TctC
MKRFPRIIASLIASSMLFAAGATTTMAQAPYPNKPIRLVIPFGAGGGTDILGRIVLTKVQENLGQPIIFDNRPGANTIIGAEQVAKAAPDGYTLLISLDMTMTMNPSLYSKLAYNPEKDFVPVGMIAATPVIFLTQSKQPWMTLQDFISHARANPGKVTYGAGAIISQVVGEQLLRAAKIDMVYTNYKGGGQALQAMLAGDIQFSIMDIATVSSALKDGRLRGLAISGDKREPTLPNVPTIREAGHPELEYKDWWAIWAPAGTPRAIVDRLNAEIGKALQDPNVQKRLAELSFHPNHGSPEQQLRHQRDDAARWDKVIKAAGLKLD